MVTLSGKSSPPRCPLFVCLLVCFQSFVVERAHLCVAKVVDRDDAAVQPLLNSNPHKALAVKQLDALLAGVLQSAAAAAVAGSSVHRREW